MTLATPGTARLMHTTGIRPTAARMGASSSRGAVKMTPTALVRDCFQ
jgi:hypothetical protein